MLANISVLDLRIVKETSARYDVDKKISSSAKAYEMFNTVLEMSQRSEEIFALMCLDTKNKVTGLFIVSHGDLSTTIVHPREVYKRALLQNSKAIIVAHNHPSGDVSPSNADIVLTKRLKEAGDILGVDMLDHIIIAENYYISLKEKEVF